MKGWLLMRIVNTLHYRNTLLLKPHMVRMGACIQDQVAMHS